MVLSVGEEGIWMEKCVDVSLNDLSEIGMTKMQSTKCRRGCRDYDEGGGMTKARLAVSGHVSAKPHNLITSLPSLRNNSTSGLFFFSCLRPPIFLV
jgi:hypothetical protein